MNDLPDIDENEAVAILLPHWGDIVDAFEHMGYTEPDTTRLVITDEVHDTCRHFAATRIDGGVLYLAPQLVHMPVETIDGILAHEAGHIVDLQNPGIFWFRNDLLLQAEELPSKGRRKVLRAWQDRSDDEVERVADEIAYQVLGVRIGYVGPSTCLVQALGRGQRRPYGLT
jgi:hypothetical protein